MKVLNLTFALLLLCSGAALAQTPDGQTPAEEVICDGETGAAFGLCNAYCEAMDCDSESPQASATACTKVQGKFMNITGRDLPCETPQIVCPCTDPAAFARSADFAAAVASPGTCNDQETGIRKEAGDLFLEASSENPGNIGTGYCGVGRYSAGFSFIDITVEEGTACVELIRASCTPE